MQNSWLACGRLNLNVVDWFHEPRRGHQEGRVAYSPCCRDDLATTAVQRFWGHDCI